MHTRSERDTSGEERATESRERASNIEFRSRDIDGIGWSRHSEDAGIRVSGRRGLSPVLAAEQRSALQMVSTERRHKEKTSWYVV